MNTFFLKVIASDKVFFSGKAEMVNIPTLDGEKVFLAHGETHHAVVGKGFAQVINNRVTVLVDSAERPEDIDKIRAEEALERAKEQMRQKQSIQEYYHSQASMARAMTRLKLSSRYLK